jgi:hypothetical protein
MNFDELWEAERLFWAGRNVDTFDLEDPGIEYGGSRSSMEKQYSDTYFGEWVRSDRAGFDSRGGRRGRRGRDE